MCLFLITQQRAAKSLSPASSLNTAPSPNSLALVFFSVFPMHGALIFCLWTCVQNVLSAFIHSWNTPSSEKEATLEHSGHISLLHGWHLTKISNSLFTCRHSLRVTLLLYLQHSSKCKAGLISARWQAWRSQCSSPQQKQYINNQKLMKTVLGNIRTITKKKKSPCRAQKPRKAAEKSTQHLLPASSHSPVQSSLALGGILLERFHATRKRTGEPQEFYHHSGHLKSLWPRTTTVFTNADTANGAARGPCCHISSPGLELSLREDLP